MGWQGSLLKHAIENTPHYPPLNKRPAGKFTKDTKTNTYKNSNSNGLPSSWWDNEKTASRDFFNFVAGASGLALIGDAIVSKGVDLYKEKLPQAPDAFAPSHNTKVPLSPEVLTPHKTTPSDFNESNSPAVTVGLMQGSEMVTLAIGSLCQIMSDASVNEIALKKEQFDKTQDFHKELNDNLLAMNIILGTILQELSTFSKSADLSALGSEISGAIGSVEPVTLETQNTITNVDMTHMNEWAKLAHNREDYLQKPAIIRDSDGEIISESSPMEQHAKKTAQHSKYLDDKNTDTVDEDEFSPMSAIAPFIPFVGSSPIYDQFTPIQNINPFMPTSMQ